MRLTRQTRVVEVRFVQSLIQVLCNGVDLSGVNAIGEGRSAGQKLSIIDIH